MMCLEGWFHSPLKFHGFSIKGFRFLVSVQSAEKNGCSDRVGGIKAMALVSGNVVFDGPFHELAAVR